MRTILFTVVLATLTAPAFAINMNGFKEAPIKRLAGAERKAFRAAVIQVLNEAPDRTTVEWKAPKTQFASKLTPLRSFDEGMLKCRETLVESSARDKYQRGLYVFCKNPKGDWQFKRPASKAAKKKS